MIFSNNKRRWTSMHPSTSSLSLTAQVCFQLFKLLWLSHVVGSHQNNIGGKDYALSYSSSPGNRSYHAFALEDYSAIHSPTHIVQQDTVSDFYKNNIRKHNLHNAKEYTENAVEHASRKRKGIQGGYTNNLTHKRRYHRSPSAANLRRHKLRGSKDIRPKPYFETRIDKETGLGARNITTVEGGRAIFICRIRHLGHNRTVSWIRKARHPVILSSGPALFTSDTRFSITTSRTNTTWRLDVNPVLEKDEGLYECQVNTRDKMSLVFKLNVAPAKAQLFGESAVYVKQGSTISLTCEINLYSEPPPDINWIHGSKVLNFDSPRGGISLVTQKTRTGTSSKLLVTRAQTSDSGAYTCNPSRGRPVVADVHIITDEYPAGLHDGQTSSSIDLKWNILLSTAFSSCVCYIRKDFKPLKIWYLFETL